MKAAISHLVALHGPAAYALIFLLPALEASAFVGFVFPGEIAVLLGGVLASEHHAALGWVLFAAIAGAIVGDSIGYFVGARWGRRLLATRLMKRLVAEQRQENAAAFLRRHGGKAVFFGRFTAALRVLVPGFAGMADVPYRRFLLYNVLGGAVWATGFVLLGFAAGESYHKVEHLVGAGGLLLLVLLIIVATLVAVMRWARSHPERVSAFGEALRRNRLLAPIGRAALAGFRFLRARFQPGSAVGLGLTAALIVLGVSGAGFGIIVRDLYAVGDLRIVDRTVLDFMITHTEGGLTGTFRALDTLAALTTIVTVVVAGTVAFRLRRRGWLPGIQLATAAAGAYLLVAIVGRLVDRSRPAVAALVRSTGGSFPSRPAAVAVAVYGTAALLVASALRRWASKVTMWGIAIAVVLAVSLARVYLRSEFFTDVLAGAALGAAWIAVIATAFRAFGPLARIRHSGDAPSRALSR